MFNADSLVFGILGFTFRVLSFGLGVSGLGLSIFAKPERVGRSSTKTSYSYRQYAPRPYSIYGYPASATRNAEKDHTFDGPEFRVVPADTDRILPNPRVQIHEVMQDFILNPKREILNPGLHPLTVGVIAITQ